MCVRRMTEIDLRRKTAVLTVWPSACTAVGVVAECVDVHATFRVGIVARHVP